MADTTEEQESQCERDATMAPRAASQFSTPVAFWGTLVLLVVLTVADGVLVVVLFDEFTEVYAQYINQGTAFVYIVWSSLILLVRWLRSPAAKASGGEGYLLTADVDDAVEQEEVGRTVEAPWYILVAIGCFNGTANFLMAISQPHTPGLTQTLLGLLGIPLVLVLSRVFLKKKPSLTAIAGATLIIAGSTMSALRPVFMTDSSNAVVVFWYSIALFASAQIFLSAERVFEDHSFSKYRALDPMVMFCWTLCTQFTLGWALYPVQTVSAFGDIELSNIPSVIYDGMLCTVGITATNHARRPHCSYRNTLIFFGYCSVDFWTYFTGLYVIQKGGANLMVIASAVALPLQQLVLCTPFLLGSLVESFFWGDAVALVCALAGFVLYHASDRLAQTHEEQETLQPQATTGIETQDSSFTGFT